MWRAAHAGRARGPGGCKGAAGVWQVGPMHLVQILLPTADNEGRRFPEERFEALRRELTERFGGATVFSQSPAEGFWHDGEGTAQDLIVIFEVMCESVDAGWWGERRRRLEAEFRQEVVVVRATEIRLL